VTKRETRPKPPPVMPKIAADVRTVAYTTLAILCVACQGGLDLGINLNGSDANAPTSNADGGTSTDGGAPVDGGATADSSSPRDARTDAESRTDGAQDAGNDADTTCGGQICPPGQVCLNVYGGCGSDAGPTRVCRAPCSQSTLCDCAVPLCECDTSWDGTCHDDGILTLACGRANCVDDSDCAGPSHCVNHRCQ